MTKQRCSNFEFLRIIAMIMIVFHHFSVHGNFSFATDSITFNRLWIQLLAIGGKIGVNIFVLISGYFLIFTEKLDYKKVLKLLGQLVFYSIVIYCFFFITGKKSFSTIEFIKSFFPVTFKRWWFASTYFVLYLLSPYIGTTLRNLPQKMYRQLLITMFIIWCLIPTFTDTSYQSNNLLWFIFLFALAGYIRLYDIAACSGKKYILLGLSTMLLTFFTVIVIDFLLLHKISLPIIEKKSTYFYGMQTVTTLFNALFIFLGFKNIRMRYSPFINSVASATFGVYLIHDHTFFRNYLWKELFINNQYSDSPYLFFYSVVIVLIVYAFCSCIELFRINTLEKLWIGVLNKSFRNF